MRPPVPTLPMLVILLTLAVPMLAQEEPQGHEDVAIDLAVEVHREALEVRFVLLQPLPDGFLAALPTGAHVRVEYPVRVRARRRLWWDRRVWRGEVVSTVAFDPVTGRYRCELLLDRVIVDGEEASSADEALSWLTAPPAVRLALPAGRRARQLYVGVRAVFSSSTKWLLFPSVEGTDWTELPVDGDS